jgi:hypothetical protein
MRKKTPDQWLEVSLLFPLALFLVSSPADSTGVVAPNPDHLDSGEFDRNDYVTTDAPFVLGQEIYFGRGKTVRGLKVCVLVENDNHNDNDTDTEEEDADKETPRAVPVSRKLMRSFKGQPVTALTTRLVDCAEPEKHIALILDRNEFRALVYYINERFRLVLQ